MKVIDAHCHLGYLVSTGEDISEDRLLESMDEHGIDLAIVMPQPQQCLEDVQPVHDRVAAFVEDNQDRARGMAIVNPRVGSDAYVKEVRRCVEDLGFIALKLHPSLHGVAPNHPLARLAFECGREFDIPVMIHTGHGIPRSLPSLAIPFALDYSDVTVILAHAGWSLFSAEAVVAAQVCDNIFLEPSWCAGYEIERMVRDLGAERVMFGSDQPRNVAPELAKIQELGLTDEELTEVLGGTARNVFGLDR